MWFLPSELGNQRAGNNGTSLKRYSRYMHSLRPDSSPEPKEEDDDLPSLEPISPRFAVNYLPSVV